MNVPEQESYSTSQCTPSLSEKKKNKKKKYA